MIVNMGDHSQMALFLTIFMLVKSYDSASKTYIYMYVYIYTYVM